MLVANDDQTKMEEGEYFAIETFGSTGRGRVVDSVCACRCYLRNIPSYVILLLGRVLSLRESEGWSSRATTVGSKMSVTAKIADLPLDLPRRNPY